MNYVRSAVLRCFAIVTSSALRASCGEIKHYDCFGAGDVTQKCIDKMVDT